jgi:phosphatidylserine/phosphatidylglycerophosphate/cardiolipin synthase-like enzyme
VVLDETFAQQMEQVFRDDLVRARPVDAAAWAGRSGWRRVKESIARRFEFFL